MDREPQVPLPVTLSHTPAWSQRSARCPGLGGMQGWGGALVPGLLGTSPQSGLCAGSWSWSTLSAVGQVPFWG